MPGEIFPISARNGRGRGPAGGAPGRAAARGPVPLPAEERSDQPESVRAGRAGARAGAAAHPRGAAARGRGRGGRDGGARGRPAGGPRPRLGRERLAEGHPGRRRGADGQGDRHRRAQARSRRPPAAACTSTCRCACARAGAATRRCSTGSASSDRARRIVDFLRRAEEAVVRRGAAPAPRHGAAHAEPAAGVAAERPAGGGSRTRASTSWWPRRTRCSGHLAHRKLLVHDQSSAPRLAPELARRAGTSAACS